MSFPKIEDVSPMMQEYLRTKQEHPECLLFYRLGDFYEMFFDDAEVASKELELTLTGKSCGLNERAPMCGIPFHAVDIYIAKLVEKGYRVAICEQVEDPRFAKGLVKREVTRIVTPGTNVSPETLDEHKNNYIMAVFYDAGGGTCGLAVSDISTGDFYATQVSGIQKILDEIQKYLPSEIVCNEAFMMSGIDIQDLRNRLSIVINTLDAHYFGENDCRQILLKHFRVSSLLALGIDDLKAALPACGALLRYLYDTQMNDLSNITRIDAYLSGKYMLLDTATRRNLELTETLREKKVHGSLLWVLDKTKTAMGARLLHQFLEQPLIDEEEIRKRFDALEELQNNNVDRDEMREYLSPVYDLERLLTKISYGSANPRDLVAFRESLRMVRPIRQVLQGFTAPELVRIREDLGDFDELVSRLDQAIDDDPPLAMKEGGIIKKGYNADIDSFREAKTGSRQLLAQMEEEVRESTGIKNLKVKYNNVFGYFFEVTNSFKDLVPDYFERKQTLVGSERYTTPQLKDLEARILGAEDKLNDLEYEEFDRLRKEISSRVAEIQKAAKAVAYIDVYASLSLVAERYGYVRPKLNDKGIIRIKDGRHPVVERMMPGDFVCNDTVLDSKKDCIAVITGPNMAGKSTYMRQVALIVLMAQIGSFVPAAKANIGIVDRIFTRVGASDDLASGQSTFMVEMSEVANILRNATKNSLLILDEIGRGTSTFDGLSIAWAVVEYISNSKLLGAKTLFATHYHELTELEGKIDSVHNYCIAVKEQGDDIVFLRKIVKGGADKSYGVQVAKLAGVPDAVINRAKEIARELEEHDLTSGAKDIMPYGEAQQLSFFRESDEPTMEHPFMAELREKDLSDMTPLEALNYLYVLQEKLKNEE